MFDLQRILQCMSLLQCTCFLATSVLAADSTKSNEVSLISCTYAKSVYLGILKCFVPVP